MQEESNRTYLNQLKLSKINEELTPSRSVAGQPMSENDYGQEYNERLQATTFKIENLHRMLERMNNIVVEQGTLIDRIDENLLQGTNNMKKANEKLS